MNKRRLIIDVSKCSEEQKECILGLLKGEDRNSTGKPMFPEPISVDVENMNYTDDKSWLIFSISEN